MNLEKDHQENNVRWEHEGCFRLANKWDLSLFFPMLIRSNKGYISRPEDTCLFYRLWLKIIAPSLANITSRLRSLEQMGWLERKVEIDLLRINFGRLHYLVQLFLMKSGNYFWHLIGLCKLSHMTNYRIMFYVNNVRWCSFR